MKPWNLLALIGLAAALTFISPPTSTFRTAVSAATTWGAPRTLVSIGTQTPIGAIVDIATERHRINSAGHVAFAASVNSDSQQRQAILFLKDDVFTKVVAQGDVLDGKTVQYLGCAFGFNDSDELVFEAYGDDWEPTIYFWNGSSASPILRIGDPTPLGGAYHNDFSCTSGAVRPTLNLNNSGQVLFAGHVSGGSSTAAIFLWASGTVTTVAAIGDSRPDGGTFTNLYLSDPHQNSLTNDGRIVFIDFGPGSSADNGRMYEWKSGVSQLIGTGDSVPDVGSTVRSVCPYYDLAAHAAGRRLALGLTYRVGTIESDGVFAYSNETLSKIALTGDTMPDGEAFDQTGSGDTCHHPAINSSGTVAFLGGRSVLTPGSKLFVSEGGEVTLLDSDRSVFAPDINDNNQVLYLFAPSNEVSELRLVGPQTVPAASTIIVRTETTPDSSIAFGYQGDGEIGQFDLSDGQSRTFTVEPGRYEIAQNHPDGWLLSSIECTGTLAFYQADLPSGTVLIELAGEQTANCTFTNEATSGTSAKVLFIQGIGSSSCADASKPSADFVDRVEWLREALIARSHLTARDFVYYTYTSGDESPVLPQSCSAGILGCPPEGCPAYGQQETCVSLDNRFSRGFLRTGQVIGQASRLASFLRTYLEQHPTVSLSIVAHSQGGVIAAYALKEELDEGLTSGIKSLITLDSPLGGINPFGVGVLRNFAGCPNMRDSDRTLDSALDLVSGSAVIRRINDDSFRPSTLLFTVDAVPGRMCWNTSVCFPFELIDETHSRAWWRTDHLRVEVKTHTGIWDGTDMTTAELGKLEDYILCAILSASSEC